MSNAPKVIDLFSGVGGLSLGAVKAGFDLTAAVEYEGRILNSHKKNFPKTKHIHSDVSTLSTSTLKSLSGLNNSELAGLIGGPPCQGFSSIGRQSIDDERNQLFINFFKLAAETNPAFFLAENVPGILHAQYTGIRNRAKKIVEKNFYLLDPIKINASNYGAATTRTRIFFIGVRNDVSGADKIPGLIESFKSENSVFVKDALAGLPEEISEDWIEFDHSWQKLNRINANKYVRLLNECCEDIGDQNALIRLERNKEVSGCFGTRHSKEIGIRYKKLKPGQKDMVSKSHKLNIDGFCPTLRAGTDNTRGSYQAVRPIHPVQPRVITPREAARLQGFPDWFQFHETKWHSFRQIGNSVCPIVAEKVLLAIKRSLSM
jgi:DNA (cytosine-5)-methyltransferase 1